MSINGGSIIGAMRQFLRSPLYLQALPAFALLGYWGIGEPGLLAAALAGPLLFILAGRGARSTRDPVTGLPHAKGFAARLSDQLREAELTDQATATLALEIDNYHEMTEDIGAAQADEVLRQIADRLVAAMRQMDHVVHLADGKFLIGLAPVRRADLEALIQIAGRLQSAVEEPFVIDGANRYLTASIGFCLMQGAPILTAASLIDSATCALTHALQNGPGSIRAYSKDMQQVAGQKTALQGELDQALDNGELVAWFQPQISTDTGRVTGLEVLARWCHPKHGILLPAEFLTALEEGGMGDRLSDLMLSQAMRALRKLDKAGLDIPMIGVNFSASELGNPKLVDKIRWELDRFDLAPDRLCIEVLETVVAGPDDDVIARNIKALSNLGCRIDLDDFGTGHASISSIRRFSVHRIKIDRSFVTHVDQDQKQRDMLTAILTMAEQLHLDTLAEGVETLAEHALLAQLGCGHVQGYAIARPMPPGDLPAWIERHNAKLAAAPQIGRRTG